MLSDGDMHHAPAIVGEDDNQHLRSEFRSTQIWDTTAGRFQRGT